jgi:hypothetical protein
MTTTTTSRIESLERTIEDLWARHDAHLADITGREVLKGTAWYDDRLELVQAIRAQIRDREAMLGELN